MFFTGVLSVASLHYLNKETRHTVNVSVSDGVHTSFAQVHIEMFSTNKHRPQFTQHQYNVKISKNLPSGTAVTTVVAYDEDSGIHGRITYSVPSHLLQQTFHINSDTGNTRIECRTKIQLKYLSVIVILYNITELYFN